MVDGLARVPPGEAAPVVGPMEVGAPLVGLNMEGAKDIPVVEALLEAGHMAPVVVDHLEEAHLEVVHRTGQGMAVGTAQEAQIKVANSPYPRVN